MNELLEEKLIDIDLIEKDTNKKFLLILFCISMSPFLIRLFFPELRQIKLPMGAFPLIILACYFYVPTTIVLRRATCPHCLKNYFPKQVCDRGELKSLVKNSQGCINCNRKAVLVSKYLSLI